jgi:hypothetical protein
MSRCQACCALTVSPTAIASAIQNDGMRHNGTADRAEGTPAESLGAGTTPVSRRIPSALRSNDQASASASGRPRAAPTITARTDQSGRPNRGKTVSATSTASQASPPYQAAVRNTCRRRSSETNDMRTLDSWAAV